MLLEKLEARGRVRPTQRIVTLAAEADDRGWRPIETAPQDGSAFLAFGIHDHSPADAQRGVEPGDYWWAIILWDVWRGSRCGWVFAKDGQPTWSAPTHWQDLLKPEGVA